MMDYAVGKGLLNLPDLRIKYATLNNGKISWCIENIGQGYAGASRLFLFAFSTKRVEEPKIPPISAGSTSCGDVLFTAADIKDGVKFTVDSDNTIKEANENNNIFYSPGKSH
jgi:subtilase family serine protease